MDSNSRRSVDGGEDVYRSTQRTSSTPTPNTNNRRSKATDDAITSITANLNTNHYQPHSIPVSVSVDVPGNSVTIPGAIYSLPSAALLNDDNCENDKDRRYRYRYDIHDMHSQPQSSVQSHVRERDRVSIPPQPLTLQPPYQWTHSNSEVYFSNNIGYGYQHRSSNTNINTSNSNSNSTGIGTGLNLPPLTKPVLPTLNTSSNLAQCSTGGGGEQSRDSGLESLNPLSIGVGVGGVGSRIGYGYGYGRERERDTGREKEHIMNRLSPLPFQNSHPHPLLTPTRERRPHRHHDHDSPPPFDDFGYPSHNSNSNSNSNSNNGSNDDEAIHRSRKRPYEHEYDTRSAESEPESESFSESLSPSTNGSGNASSSAMTTYILPPLPTSLTSVSASGSNSRSPQSISSITPPLSKSKYLQSQSQSQSQSHSQALLLQAHSKLPKSSNLNASLPVSLINAGNNVFVDNNLHLHPNVDTDVNSNSNSNSNSATATATVSTTGAKGISKENGADAGAGTSGRTKTGGAKGAKGGNKGRGGKRVKLQLAADQPPTTHGKERERVFVACVQCRTRKIRCTGEKPSCYNCTWRGLSGECKYDAAPKRRGPDRRPGKRLRGVGVGVGGVGDGGGACSGTGIVSSGAAGDNSAGGGNLVGGGGLLGGMGLGMGVMMVGEGRVGLDGGTGPGPGPGVGGDVDGRKKRGRKKDSGAVDVDVEAAVDIREDVGDGVNSNTNMNTNTNTLTDKTRLRSQHLYSTLSLDSPPPPPPVVLQESSVGMLGSGIGIKMIKDFTYTFVPHKWSSQNIDGGISSGVDSSSRTGLGALVQNANANTEEKINEELDGKSSSSSLIAGVRTISPSGRSASTIEKTFISPNSTPDSNPNPVYDVPTNRSRSYASTTLASLPLSNSLESYSGDVLDRAGGCILNDSEYSRVQGQGQMIYNTHDNAPSSIPASTTAESIVDIPIPISILPPPTSSSNLNVNAFVADRNNSSHPHPHPHPHPNSELSIPIVNQQGEYVLNNNNNNGSFSSGIDDCVYTNQGRSRIDYTGGGVGANAGAGAGGDGYYLQSVQNGEDIRDQQQQQQRLTYYNYYDPQQQQQQEILSEGRGNLDYISVPNPNPNELRLQDGITSNGYISVPGNFIPNNDGYDYNHNYNYSYYNYNRPNIASQLCDPTYLEAEELERERERYRYKDKDSIILPPSIEFIRKTWWESLLEMYADMPVMRSASSSGGGGVSGGGRVGFVLDEDGIGAGAGAGVEVGIGIGMEISHQQQQQYTHQIRQRLTNLISSHLKYLFLKSNYWISFINIPLFFRSYTLFHPSNPSHQSNARESEKNIQPALIFAALAMSVLIQSSEMELGAVGRKKAMVLRDAAQASFEASVGAGWVDTTLAQAAWLMALFELSCHPLQSYARTHSVLHQLESIIRLLGLMDMDAGEREVSVFEVGKVPSVRMDVNLDISAITNANMNTNMHMSIMDYGTHQHQQPHLYLPSPLSRKEGVDESREDISGININTSAHAHAHITNVNTTISSPLLHLRSSGPPEPSPHPTCLCEEISLGKNWSQVNEIAPLWTYTPAWNSSWSEVEIRKEESRRLVWTTLTLVAGYTNFMTAFDIGYEHLNLMDPWNYRLFFPGETFLRARFPQSRNSPKDTVWALYARAMMLWNLCVRMRGALRTDGERAQFAQNVWAEADEIEDALNLHRCHTEKAFMYHSREYLFNSRMCISNDFRRYVPYPATSGQFDRRKAEEWLSHQANIGSRIMGGLSQITGHKNNILMHRPFFLYWFMSEIARCLKLWSLDQDLVLALHLSKALIDPIDYLTALWPCQAQRQEYAVLRESLTQACIKAGVLPPRPPPDYSIMISHQIV